MWVPVFLVRIFNAVESTCKQSVMESGADHLAVYYRYCDTDLSYL